jgi:hypothetical protein
LPAGPPQVNGLFAAVPQIERKLTGHPSGTPRNLNPLARPVWRAFDDDQECTRVMIGRPAHISRRSLAIAAALAVSLALGAHAALNQRPLDAAKPAATDEVTARSARIALVIGNGHYPDAHAPLAHPINDARALMVALRRNGFDVDMVEDAGKDDMNRAIERLKSKVAPDSVVMLFFGGFGVQVGRESYMIPVDAAIWKEADVRRDGVSIESVLEAMKAQGARARLAVIDASRRNPYERRFRTFSHGLAPIVAPENALILSSATPGKVVDDSDGQHSVLMTELLTNLAGSAASAEAVFNQTRAAISRASDGEQVPSVSSSLSEDVRLDAVENVGG